VSAVPESGPSTVSRFPILSYVIALVAVRVPAPLPVLVEVTLPLAS